MYAQENHRFFPVVSWQPTVGSMATLPPAYGGGGINPNEDAAGNDKERIWVDFLAKYLIKKETYSNPTTYALYQNSSVFWGCPAFNTAIFDPTGTYPSTALGSRRYSMSYGMQRLAIGPYRTGSGSTDTSLPSILGPKVGTTTTFTFADQGGVAGTWYKMEQWGRHGQSKALIFDSNGFSIVASGTWLKADEQSGVAKSQPAVMGMDYPLAGNPTGSTFISIDATRHISPTANKNKVMGSRGTNCLFVDGHAAPVTPREAWIACQGAGTDLTQ